MERPTLTTTLLPGPILECLLDCLPIAALRSLQLTCHHFAGLYDYALPTRWKVDDRLAQFVPNPKLLRRQLTASHAIISGSFALCFFDHLAGWEPSDVDIYLHCAYIRQMHLHLVQRQACIYTGRKAEEDSEYPARHILEVRSYAHRDESTGRLKRIQLICLKSKPADERGRIDHLAIESMLESFYSTAVLNYLTGTEAVSLYSFTTFITRRTYLKKPWDFLEASLGRTLRKYVDRGWTIHDLGRSESKRPLHPMRKARSLGDKMCWRISYGEDGIARKPSSLAAPPPQLWWTTDTVRHAIWRDIEVPLTDAEEELRPGQQHHSTYTAGRSRTQTHYYHFSSQGLLTAGTQERAYAILSRLPATHSAHQLRLFGSHGQDAPHAEPWCDCMAGEASHSDRNDAASCRVYRLSLKLRGQGVWHVGELEREAAAWSLETVGPWASVGEMVKMAEDRAEEEALGDKGGKRECERHPC